MVSVPFAGKSFGYLENGHQHLNQVTPQNPTTAPLTLASAFIITSCDSASYIPKQAGAEKRAVDRYEKKDGMPAKQPNGL